MTPTDARTLLELPADATPEQVEQRFLELQKRFEEKIAGALTPTLRGRYEAALAEMTRAYETLVLSADGAVLPGLTPASDEPSPGERTRKGGRAPHAVPTWRRRLGLGVLTLIVLVVGGAWGLDAWRTYEAGQLGKKAQAAQQAGDWETALRSRRLACEQQSTDETRRAYEHAQTTWLAALKERLEIETPVALHQSLKTNVFPASRELDATRAAEFKRLLQAGHARIKAHVQSGLAQAQKLAEEERKFTEAEALLDQLAPLAADGDAFKTESDKVRVLAARAALDAVKDQMQTSKDFTAAAAAVEGLKDRPGLARADYLEARVQVRLFELVHAIEGVGTQAKEGDFAEALAAQGRIEKLGREMERMEGYAALVGELNQGMGEKEKFSIDEMVKSVRQGIEMRIAWQTVGELAAALKARDAVQAQTVLDGFATLMRRTIPVSGEALVRAGAVEPFLADLKTLGLGAGGEMNARLVPAELALVEAKLADFNSDEAKPAALRHLRESYGAWAAKLLAEEAPGLALYALKRGAWLAVLDDPALTASVREKFAQQYPLTLHLPETEALREDGQALVAHTRRAIREALHTGGQGWITLIEQAPSEEEAAEAVVVRTTTSGITTERTRHSTRASVRFQSGTENRANPDYDQAVREVRSAEQAENEAVETKKQAQAQLDSATDKTLQALAAVALVAANSDAGKAERALAAAKARLAATPRYLQGAVYSDEPYEVVNRRVNHAAALGVTLEHATGDGSTSELASWSANLRYATVEITGDARRGVPVQKPMVLESGAVAARLGADLAGKVTAQRELLLERLAAAVLAKRKKKADEEGRGSGALADFECGAALLWEQAGVRVDYAALEKAVYGALEFPAALQFPDAFLYRVHALVGAQRENGLGMRFSPLPGTETWMSLSETRVQDFAVFVKATQHAPASGMFSLTAEGWKQLRGASWTTPGFEQDTKHPVCGVSWLDAKAFCAWLTTTERDAGRLAPNQRYRLPTVAEWRRACGTPVENEAGTAGKTADDKAGYVWGVDWPPPLGAGNFAGADAVDGSWPAGWVTLKGWRDGFARTAPAASFSANRFGFHDLDGNVSEWSEDNGQNPQERVVCGGAFIASTPEKLRGTAQFAAAPIYSGSNIGFRVVLVTEEAP